MLIVKLRSIPESVEMQELGYQNKELLSIYAAGVGAGAASTGAAAGAAAVVAAYYFPFFVG